MPTIEDYTTQLANVEIIYNMESDPRKIVYSSFMLFGHSCVLPKQSGVCRIPEGVNYVTTGICGYHTKLARNSLNTHYMGYFFDEQSPVYSIFDENPVETLILDKYVNPDINQRANSDDPTFLVVHKGSNDRDILVDNVKYALLTEFLEPDETGKYVWKAFQSGIYLHGVVKKPVWIKIPLKGSKVSDEKISADEIRKIYRESIYPNADQIIENIVNKLDPEDAHLVEGENAKYPLSVFLDVLRNQMSINLTELIPEIQSEFIQIVPDSPDKKHIINIYDVLCKTPCFKKAPFSPVINKQIAQKLRSDQETEVAEKLIPSGLLDMSPSPNSAKGGKSRRKKLKKHLRYSRRRYPKTKSRIY